MSNSEFFQFIGQVIESDRLVRLAGSASFLQENFVFKNDFQFNLKKMTQVKIMTVEEEERKSRFEVKPKSVYYGQSLIESTSHMKTVLVIWDWN